MPEPWGGHRNGRIPLSELRVVQLAENRHGQQVSHLRLRTDAAKALDRILAQIPRGKRYMTDAYRDYATQVRLKAEKGRYAATPGTSNHGWAMAADLAYAAANGAARWMWEHEAECLEHGWYPPAWTHDGRGIEEPWHWEYDHTKDQHRGETGDTEEDDMPALKRPAKGAPVKVLQWRLQAVGLLPDGADDGVFGGDTEAAVKAFQESGGYPATGEYDWLTADRLLEVATIERGKR